MAKQASFYCPQCQQPRLFRSEGMNHVLHLLASVFLCGLWLPIWILTAITETPSWHCAFCGFYDQQRYLMNPSLRDTEARQEQAAKAERELRRAEREQRSVEMSDMPTSGRISYFISDNKHAVIALGIVAATVGVLIIGFVRLDQLKSERLAAERAKPTQPPRHTPEPSPTPKKRKP